MNFRHEPLKKKLRSRLAETINDVIFLNKSRSNEKLARKPEYNRSKLRRNKEYEQRYFKGEFSKENNA